MNAKFQFKDAIEYFLEYSSDILSSCYGYFLTQKPKGDFKDIYVPDCVGEPPLHEKLLCVVSFISNHFDAKIFQQYEETCYTEEIAAKSKTPLPTLHISGMIRNPVLTILIYVLNFIHYLNFC